MPRKKIDNPRRTGRPSKFTKAIARRFLKAISKGLIRRHAALCCGINESTFKDWAAQGKASGKGDLYAFYLDLKKAEALAQECRAQTIIVAARKNWQAAAWWLERKYPEIWGRKDAFTVDGKMQTANLNINGSQAQLPSRDELIAELEKTLLELKATNGQVLITGPNGQSNGENGHVR